MKMHKIAILGSVLLSFAFGAKAISDAELGLRNAPLNSEDKVKLKDYKYGDKAPGESQVFDRAYENAPPMIPHDVEGMTDFTQDDNMCLSCHSPENAKGTPAKPVPESHLHDLRNAKAITDGISDSRWNCTQCHAPQAQVKPLVGNTFKPEYRNKNSKNGSNLFEVLDEGVK